MCGRAVQSVSAVEAAATNLGIPIFSDLLQVSATDGRTNVGGNESGQSSGNLEPQVAATSEKVNRDNYNMSPGMDAVVFMKNTTNGTDSQYLMSRMTWGLIARGGTSVEPLPQGMAKHFNSLMFNARSDTLFSKPTFNGLVNAGQSCIIAVDGFFEWKTEIGQKQPYYVYRKNHEGSNQPYLLFQGLWKRVQTGWEEYPFLDTFTVVTTEVCEPLKWLHTRMPVTVWDTNLAKSWLDRPSSSIHLELERAAQHSRPDFFLWHSVTPAMSSMKFRSIDAIKPLRKQKTVKSFFTNPVSSVPSKEKKSKPSDDMNQSPLESLLPKLSAVTAKVNLSSPNVVQIGVSDQKRKATPQSLKGTSITPKKLKVTTPNRTIDSFFKPKSNTRKKDA